MNVVVTGAAGQLGAATVSAWSAAGHTVAGLTRSDLDITRAADVRRVIGAIRPDLILNCAADNRVDAAESAPLPPLAGNAWAVASLARLAADVGATFVHYSTDFVFDGDTDRPYTEADPPNPRSVYGMTKLLGEMLATDAPRHYVLRVESLFGRAPGGPPAKGSVQAIVEALRSGAVARVFEDRTVSPTYVPHAARAMRELLERGAPTGLYHCVSSGHCTWLEFALAAAEGLGVEPRVQAVRVAEVKLRAERPKYCALSNARLAAIGVELPTWQAALKEYLSTFSDDLRDQIAHS